MELLPELGRGKSVLVHISVDSWVFSPAATYYLVAAEVHHTVDVSEGRLVECAFFHQLFYRAADVNVRLLIRWVKRHVVNVARVAGALSDN